MRTFVLILSLLIVRVSFSLPNGFAYLSDIAPDVEQDMRYATYNNFVGRPINGYIAGKCILTKQAALALKRAQKIARKQGYRLKVYDCYRPQRAVNDFYQWSNQKQTVSIDPHYYPRVNKSSLFKKGYIARYSGHTRGSAVDLTLTPIKSDQSTRQHKTTERCYASTVDYLNDNSINMGTRYDCLDPSAHFRYQKQSKEQFSNRKKLRKIMSQVGFKPYYKEWWHFSLREEPFPRRYFNFLVK